MEYVYAALILHESGEEINEENVTGVLEAAGVDVEESRVKALVAALEDVDVEEAIASAAAAPAGGAGGAGGVPDTTEEADADDGDDEEEAEEADADDGDDEEEEEDVSGEGLGDLFG